MIMNTLLILLIIILFQLVFNKLSVNKWEKSNSSYFFEKVTQIFSCKLKSNALLY